MSVKKIDDLGFEQRYKSQYSQFLMRDTSILNAYGSSDGESGDVSCIGHYDEAFNAAYKAERETYSRG
jgi:hypothetical protein